MDPSSAVEYRTLSPALTLTGPSGSSLQNRNPDPYPDGALCFVLEQRSLYRLAKRSTETVSSPSVIPTIYGAGAPGRWIQLTGDRALEALGALLYCDASFVGVSTGSIAAPYRTLQEAIDALPVTGGSIIIVVGTYPDSWVVPAGLAVNLLAASGSQGAPGGGVTIAGGTVLAGGGVRLQEFQISGDILLVGNNTGCLAEDVGFAGHSVVHSGGGFAIVRIVSSGIDDAFVGDIVDAGQLITQNIVIRGDITVSGTLARILNSVLESDFTFTGAAGLFLSDLFTLNSARGHASEIINAGSIVAVDAPTLGFTIASPVFGAAGIQTVNVTVPDARPGDTFAVANTSALPTGVTLGQPTCSVSGTVAVTLFAFAAALGGNVDIRLTRFNGSTGLP